MPKLIILRGASGSGKSTYAKSQFGTVVVSRDTLREQFFGSSNADYYDVDKKVLKSRENFITKVHDFNVEQALVAGYNVIVDNTHTEPRFAQAVANIGYKAGAHVEVKTFAEPLETLVKRNARRAEGGGRNVPEHVIRRQHDQLAGTLDWAPTAPVEFETYSGTPGKPAAFLYDLDGTVYHMGDKRGPYDHNVDVDDPDMVVIAIIQRLASAGLVPVAMSGRKAATRELTEFCLDRDFVPFDALFMRADDDNRKDSLIKHDLFNEHIRDNYDVQFVLDDRNQVVNMWRAMGIKCLQVEPGEF